MLEGLRGYVQLASGLTEATAARAREVAQALVAQGGVSGIPANASTMAVQIAGLAEDLVETAKSNRGVLGDLIRAEVERVVASVGVVTAADVEALRRRIADLESALADEAPSHPKGSGAAAPGPQPGPTPGPESGAARTAARATATKAGAPKHPRPATATTTRKSSPPVKKAPPVPSEQAAGRKTAATRPAAKKSAGKKSVAKKSAAQQVPARKASAKKAGPVRETATTSSASPAEVAAGTTARRAEDPQVGDGE